MRRIISILLIVTLLNGCDGLFNEVSDAEHVSRAQTYLDENELKSAAIELKNALSKNPDNAQARWLLGRFYVKAGNGLAAEKELNKARELGVNDDSVLPLLLEALLLQENYSRVLEQDISSVRTKNVVAELLASRGLAYIFQNKLDKAGQELDVALLQGPDLPYVLTAKARLSAAARNQEEARSYLDKALEHNSIYAPAWSLVGDLTALMEGPEKAIEAYAKAIENRAYNTADLLKRAFLFIQLKRYEEAQSDLSLLKTKLPDSPDIHYAQGVLYFFQKRFAEAQESLEIVLEGNHDEMLAIFYLGATHFMQNNNEQAKEYLSRFVTVVPGYIPGRTLFAQVKLRDQEFAEAEALLRPVVKTTPEDVFALNLLANALIEQGKTDEAIELLEKVVELQPGEAAAKMQLGVGLLAKGDKEQGVENLEGALEIDPQFQQADVLLVLNYLKEKDIDKALKAAKSFISRQPENVVAHNMLGSVYLAGDQEEEAEHAFQAARKLVPGDPRAGQQLAALALKNKKPEKARMYLKEVLKSQPGHLRTLLELAVLEAKEEKKEAMEAVLKEAMAAHPDAVEPRILLAQEYMKNRKIDQARIVLGDIIEKNRDDPDVLSVLGELQLNSGDFLAARSILRRLVNLQPKKAQAHFLLASVYGGLRNRKDFKTELEKTLELEPAHVPARIALMRLLMTDGKTDVVRENLASLKEAAGENPDVLMLEGMVLEKLGEKQSALAVYKKLFKLQPNNTTLFFLTRFQQSIGQKEEAIKILEQWNRDHPGDIDVMLKLASSYLTVDREAEAIGQYQHVLKLSENNLMALNDLAWYLRKSDLNQALSYAERAAAIAPESIIIMDTLAMLLINKGEMVRAQRLISRALGQEPENPTLNYRRILFLDKNGQKSEAKNDLAALLKKDSQFPERAEAERMFKRLSDM
ncbi:XrtA/PEP-CTERM system TPR-repeat protein PrsT [Pseudomonadota bacterium]